MPRLLLVDDDVQVAKAIRRFLVRHRFDVCVVHDGPAALEVAATFRPDVVLSDFDLPGMNGHQVLTELQRRHPGVRGVLISGYAHVEGDLAFPFVAKPWDDPILLATVSGLPAAAT